MAIKIEIENKEIVQTATNIGIAINAVSEFTTEASWSLNDENNQSIIEGKETFDSASTPEIIEAIFKKLNITKKQPTENEQPTTTTEPTAAEQPAATNAEQPATEQPTANNDGTNGTGNN